MNYPEHQKRLLQIHQKPASDRTSQEIADAVESGGHLMGQLTSIARKRSQPPRLNPEEPRNSKAWGHISEIDLANFIEEAGSLENSLGTESSLISQNASRLSDEVRAIVMDIDPHYLTNRIAEGTAEAELRAATRSHP